jgi:predicted AlkP superfamily phosphohydrolase/phosphomutase
MGAIFLYGKDKEKKGSIKQALKNDKNIEDMIEYNIDGFPDFLIALKDDFIFTMEPSFFLKRRIEVFSHTNQGFFLAYGKNIKQGNEKLIKYQDIAPSILKLFGLKKLEHMKGKSLDIFH